MDSITHHARLQLARETSAALHRELGALAKRTSKVERRIASAARRHGSSRGPQDTAAPRKKGTVCGTTSAEVVPVDCNSYRMGWDPATIDSESGPVTRARLGKMPVVYAAQLRTQQREGRAVPVQRSSSHDAASDDGGASAAQEVGGQRRNSDPAELVEAEREEEEGRMRVVVGQLQEAFLALLQKHKPLVVGVRGHLRENINETYHGGRKHSKEGDGGKTYDSLWQLLWDIPLTRPSAAPSEEASAALGAQVRSYLDVHKALVPDACASNAQELLDKEDVHGAARALRAGMVQSSFEPDAAPHEDDPTWPACLRAAFLACPASLRENGVRFCVPAMGKWRKHFEKYVASEMADPPQILVDLGSSSAKYTYLDDSGKWKDSDGKTKYLFSKEQAALEQIAKDIAAACNALTVDATVLVLATGNWRQNEDTFAAISALLASQSTTGTITAQLVTTQDECKWSLMDTIEHLQRDDPELYGRMVSEKRGYMLIEGGAGSTQIGVASVPTAASPA